MSDMKSLNVIAAAALFGTSFITATPAHARCMTGFIQRGNQCFPTAAASKKDKESFCRGHAFQYGPRMVEEGRVDSLAQYFDNCMNYSE